MWILGLNISCLIQTLSMDPSVSILMGFDCKNLSGKYFINTNNYYYYMPFIILSFIMPLFVCLFVSNSIFY